VIHILRQICGSLGEAHELGLVHRDVKPGNIMLTRRGGICDVVKVLDFGLVKPVNNALDLDATVAETVAGTPRYMSPEAFEKPESADARSDLYSLGAVGYFLLVGQAVFDGDTPHEVLLKQVRELPRSPSRRLGRTVDADLERLILQCLAKDRSQRPLNARQLDDALARSAAAGQWTQAEATDWRQTHHASIEEAPLGKAAERTLVILPRV
jgi:serine/threonine protein kinase